MGNLQEEQLMPLFAVSRNITSAIQRVSAVLTMA